MHSANKYTLQKCPLCGGKGSESSCTDYEFAFKKNLEHIAKAEESRSREFSYLGKTVEEIKERLFWKFYWNRTGDNHTSGYEKSVSI